jgi:cell division protein FtsA
MNHSTTSSERPIAVAVDIGTTKVCALAGRLDDYGKLEILAISRVESEGILRGVVSNIEKTVSAIDRAIRIIEQRLGKRVHTIHVGIAGQHVKSMQHRGSRMRENAELEISQDDIQNLINDMHRLHLPAGDKIIHVIPQEYTIDNEPGIVDPVGMSGVRLEGQFHIVTGQLMAINNIRRCIEKVNLQLRDLTLEPLASGASVLSDEEKEAGVALVDIGGGTTDLAIYFENVARHIAVIPFGSNSITKDIKEGCHVMQNQAEKMKVKFGHAIAREVRDDKIITIPGLKGRDNKEISQRNLSLIIQARIEEIFDYIMWEIKKSGYENKLTGGIVVTGGGSMMRDIEKLISYHTGFSARRGLPTEHLAHGYHESIADPAYATVLGLLYSAASVIRESEVENVAPRVRQAEVEVEIVNQEVSTHAYTERRQSGRHASPEREVESSVPEVPVNNEPKESLMNRILSKAREYFEAADDDDLK